MGVNNCIDCDKKQAIIDCNCIPLENSDGTLQDIVLGCTDPTSCNYNALANCDDGSCIEKNPGCMDPSSLNYSSCFNADCAGNCPGTEGFIAGGTYGNDSCCCSIAGCTDSAASNYNASACIDDGSCTYPGCIDPAGCNYDASVTVDDGSCTYPQTASVSATACDNYTWALSGQTYTTSGSYPYTASGSCPTTTTLNLTINNATTGSSTQDVCASYTWAGPLGDGNTYTTAGTHTHTSTNAAGCTHTETLYLTIKPNGCTDATAVNYDPAAECDTGCIAAVGGCTYGGAVLPSWNGTALGVSDSYAQVYPGQADPGAAASNYNAGANVENGSCNFAVPGCTDATACNYDPNATTDDGSCVTPTSQDLGEANYGKETPNCVKPDGAHQKGCNSSFQFGCDNAFGYGSSNYGISAYPFEAGEPVFGAHCTDHLGSSYMEMPNYGSGDGSNNDQKVYSETYFFMATNLTIGNTVCITWAEIVLALRHNGSCSDCLTGGWWVKIDTGTGSPGWAAINAATSLYNPIPVGGTVSHGTSPGGLSTANALYHNSLCETNDPGNSNGQNTAGAPNGSYSTWDTKCITFVATDTTHRIHFIAITDFDTGKCTTCNWKPSTSAHGSYMGISKVQISSDGCTGNCSC